MQAVCEVPEVIEVTNKYGFTEFQFSDQPDMPVCADCNAYVMPNRGQGCLCSECNNRINVEFELDYAAGLL